MRTLIVDDDLVSRAKLVEIMRGQAETTAVDNGEDAVSCFNRAWEDLEPFDLIFLDINLPGISGWDALKEIRAAEKDLALAPPARIKTIMVSSRSDQETVLSMLNAGCDDYIVKPFQPSVVEEKVRRLFLPPPIVLR